MVIRFFQNVFGMMQFLTGDWTQDLPQANTLPLGYWGGGDSAFENHAQIRPETNQYWALKDKVFCSR